MDMIRSGTRGIKTINGKKYIYYQYRDQKGKRETKYCGSSDKIESEIKVLEFELTCMKHIKHQCEQRTIEIKFEINKLKNDLN